MVRAVLEVVLGPQEEQYKMVRATGEWNLVFYADDGRILGRDHIWLQDALTVTVEMFRRVGLDTNLESMRALVCIPGYIWGNWSEAAYNRKDTGEGVNFRERNRSRVSFSECGVTVVVLSLKGHTERHHDRSVPQTRQVEIGGGGV